MANDMLRLFFAAMIRIDYLSVPGPRYTRISSKCMLSFDCISESPARSQFICAVFRSIIRVIYRRVLFKISLNLLGPDFDQFSNTELGDMWCLTSAYKM